MNRIALPFLLCTVLAGLASAQFEGVIESKNLTTDETGKKVEYQMTLWVKENMVKVKTTSMGIAPGGMMIYRSDKGMIWILNDEEKSYLEIDQNEQVVEQYTSGAADKYTIRRTGKKKTLLRYPCEQIILSKGTEKTEIWGTAKLKHLNAALAKAFGEQSGGVQAWDDELTKLGLYPMSARVMIDGHLAESQEVIVVSEKKLDEELFQIPSGYKKDDMGKMFEGIKNE